MNIGFVGVGKLGFPVCLALEHYGGHKIFAYDLDENIHDYIKNKQYPHRERDLQQFLLKSKNFNFFSLPDVVSKCDIIFTAIQTPHRKEFEGATPLPPDRKDFDYSFLSAGVEEIAFQAEKKKRNIIIVVISTCLPGTMDREIKTKLDKYNNYCRLVYNPFFIAMGQVIDDYVNPEFVLLGCDDIEDDSLVSRIYDFYHNFYINVKERYPLSTSRIQPIQIMPILVSRIYDF